MASPPLSPIEEWCRVLRSQASPLSVRKVRERLSVLAPVDWTSNSGTRLLGALARALDARPPGLSVYVKLLDEIERFGGTPALWQAVFQSPKQSWSSQSQDTCLVLRMLSGRPTGHASTKHPPTVWSKWEHHVIQGLSHLPPSETVCARVLGQLVDRTFGSLVTEGHTAVASVALNRWPDLWVQETPAGHMWLHASLPSSVWKWALDQGMDPMAVMPGTPLPKPLWRRAAEQGHLPAARWGRDHDPHGWENHRSYQYFLAFEKLPSFARSVDHLADVLLHREDWGTLRDERGRSALWQACHHGLAMTCYRGLERRFQVHGWREATDEEGRNLAFAVLASPDPNTANGARQDSLRWLHQTGVPLARDRSGRGIMISWPQVLAIPRLEEIAATYCWPDTWWAGTDAQVEAAIQHWSRQKLSSLFALHSVMDQIPPPHPYLRAIHGVLKLIRGESVSLPADARLPPSFSLESELGQSLVKNVARDAVMVLLRHTTAPVLSDRVSRPRRRT